MRMSRFAALVAAFILAGTAAAASGIRPIGEWVFDGEASRSPRAGHSKGGTAEMTLPARTGLKEIWWEEDADRPCAIVVSGRDVNNSDSKGNDWTSHCMSYNPNPFAPTGGKTVGWPDYSNDVYISAIRVCLNRDGDRVKGLQVRGRVLHGDGTLETADAEPREELTNCHHWTSWSSCGAGQIATGLYAYFEPRDNPRAFWAVQLKCRSVRFDASGGATPFRLTGPTTETRTAGEETKHAFILRFDTATNFALDRIVWSEKQDRPCRIKIRGRDLNDRDRLSGVAERDECDGDSPDRSERTVTTGNETENVFIASISVCLNNRRLKGVDVEASRLAPPDARAPDYDRGIGSGDSQVNCFLGGSAWSDFMRCPTRQIAVGVKVFFFRGEEPSTIRGLRLLCRGYEVGR